MAKGNPCEAMVLCQALCLEVVATTTKGRAGALPDTHKAFRLLVSSLEFLGHGQGGKLRQVKGELRAAEALSRMGVA